MPPALPSRPLSYTTNPSVLPYTLRFHPYAPSATSQVHHTHRLCVGAAVISTPSSRDKNNNSSSNNTNTIIPPRILLLQRSAREKALPHRWELPGGAAESRDGDALAAAARELWEETGLRAARFAALVGAYQWDGAGDSAAATAVPGDQAWGLPGGGVGVAESADVVTGRRRDAWRKYTYLVEVETEAGGGTDVVVDPEEHEAFVWATEDEARAGRCGDVVLDWTSENQRLDVLKAFEIAKKGR
ncbi:Putative NUDIX hydrolase domain-containing protein [Colletotrichum destructivum]|uniref:NUDIX hydrolase domain-containing protein n=1 Tax=Colletotrichum destructivum TaxID=34406 RepID=A0AAX4IKS2_9PEZI|nr:Putative NUDIX hydrolase domain-containing protein [Colletotrichum destructivum]